MKKVSLGILIGLGMTLLISFSSDKTQEVKNSSAEVNQIEGIYIFTDCKPVKTYKYLGTIKYTGTFATNSQYEGVRNALIKRVKKEHPEANGAILYLNYGQADKADAIKFE